MNRRVFQSEKDNTSPRFSASRVSAAAILFLPIVRIVVSVRIAAFDLSQPELVMVYRFCRSKPLSGSVYRFLSSCHDSQGCRYSPWSCTQIVSHSEHLPVKREKKHQESQSSGSCFGSREFSLFLGILSVKKEPGKDQDVVVVTPNSFCWWYPLPHVEKAPAEHGSFADEQIA
jgi:hypothetical protein